MIRDNTAVNVVLLLVAAALVVLIAMTFGEMPLTHHAKIAHAGETWQAPDIATYLDCHPDQVRTVTLSDGKVKAYCPLNKTTAIGLVIAAIAGGWVVVTGFAGRCKWWESKL